jgi:hypothetical protein
MAEAGMMACLAAHNHNRGKKSPKKKMAQLLRGLSTSALYSMRGMQAFAAFSGFPDSFRCGDDLAGASPIALCLHWILRVAA